MHNPEDEGASSDFRCQSHFVSSCQRCTTDPLQPQSLRLTIAPSRYESLTFASGPPFPVDLYHLACISRLDIHYRAGTVPETQSLHGSENVLEDTQVIMNSPCVREKKRVVCLRLSTISGTPFGRFLGLS